MKHLHDIPRETAPRAKAWFENMFVSTATPNTLARNVELTYDRYRLYYDYYAASTDRTVLFDYRQTVAGHWIVTRRG